MAEHSYTSRRELDQYTFHPAVTLLAPLACILLQAMVPKTLPWLAILDLPLLATIFFAVARRNPIAGTVTGTLIGLLQDGLTNHPFGVYGIAKAIVGYAAASIGFVVDVENIPIRAGLTFGFSVLQSVLLYLIAHLLLGDPTYAAHPVHELLRAVVNSAVAIPVFFLLDRFKTRAD
jgi:rod shape-determining protein MreD